MKWVTSKVTDIIESKGENKMDKITGDTFVDVYLIGSIKSLNIRLDQRDKKSLNIVQKKIGIKLPSVRKTIEMNGVTGTGNFFKTQKHLKNLSLITI